MASAGIMMHTYILYLLRTRRCSLIFREFVLVIERYWIAWRVSMEIVVRKMKDEDLVDVREVDLIAWTDLMERSCGLEAKLTPRTDENILSYLHSDPDGALVACEDFAGIVGSVFSHVWGTTGWVGPLSVLPSYQAMGFGKELLKRSLMYLEDQRCVDIGLETMPESQVNLGMYLKVGLRPEGLVLILGRKLDKMELQDEPVGDIMVERLSESNAEQVMKNDIRRISGSLRMGLDYTKEVELAQKHSFGDTILATARGRVVGFSVVHTASKRMNMMGAVARIIAVDPSARDDVLEPLMASAELMAADAGAEEISLAIPLLCRRALDAAFSRGYNVIQSFERLMWSGSSGIGERVINLCSWSG